MLISANGLALTPEVASSSLLLDLFSLSWGWTAGRRSESTDTPLSAREPVVEELRSLDEWSRSSFCWVLDGQEVVSVADQDSDKFVQSSPAEDHVEGDEDPREVHGLKSGAKPEGDCGIFVELAPVIENTEDHGIQQEVHTKGKSKSLKEYKK